MRLSRQRLYKWVWSTPVDQIAKVIALSGTQIKRVCIEFNIPTPGRGYWVKLRAGQAPEIAPLPDPEDVRLTSIEVNDDDVFPLADADRWPHSQGPALKLQEVDTSGLCEQVPAALNSGLVPPVQKPSTAVEGQLPALLLPDVDALMALARASEPFAQLERLLSRVEARLDQCDESTRSVLRLWLDAANKASRGIDPAWAVVDQCRKLAKASGAPEWWARAARGRDEC